MELTAEQQSALDYILQYIKSGFDKARPDTYICTLSGAAGTGKTTLTKYIVKAVRKSGKQVICVAPTHKARKVLNSIINTSTFVRIPTTTVASLLGKIRAHGYIGTQNYRRGMDTKIGMYDFIVVDEISMITTDDYSEIVSLARDHEKKLLFIGDSSQIPHPSQGYRVEPGGYMVKEISPAFVEPYQLRLTQTVRQSGMCNPLSVLLSQVRDRIGEGVNLGELVSSSSLANNEVGELVGYQFVDASSKFTELVRGVAPRFTDGQYRIISYTNHSVSQYNRLVRNCLGYTTDLVTGDIITGYNTVGPWQEPTIENGQDYLVTELKVICDHQVSANGRDYRRLVGTHANICELNDSKTQSQIFIPDLNDESNNSMLEDLVMLAMKVNKTHSSKVDYRNYITLKSQVVFMEDLYKYSGGIYTGTEFKHMHPLLFTKTTEVLTARGEVIPSEITDKIETAYPGLLTDRASDNNKEISKCETLADMYQVLEKDISYGYALTSHKSQGSTYHTVFIDEPDFNALRDRWSYKHRMDIRAGRERDQLKYTALSRPTHVAYILSSA